MAAAAMLADVIISHSGRDSLAAGKIAEALKRRGIDVWIDPTVLVEGRMRAARIAISAELCKAMVFLFSSSTDRIDWHAMGEIDVWDELIERSVSRTKPPIVVPVQIEPSRIPSGLSDHGVCKLYEKDFDAEMDRIADNIRRILKGRSVFISYRRADTPEATQALYDYLADKIGQERVFLDVVDVAAGDNFRLHLEDTLTTCDYMVVVLGPRWLTEMQAYSYWKLRHVWSDGKKTTPDFVRFEIETALRRKIRILPVLIDGAKMPSPEDVPWQLYDFTCLNGIALDSTNPTEGLSKLIRSVDGPSPNQVAQFLKRLANESDTIDPNIRQWIEDTS